MFQVYLRSDSKDKNKHQWNTNMNMSLVGQPIWHVHKATLNGVTLLDVKIACVLKKFALTHNESKTYTSKC
jgi:hypothetical protein